MTVFTIKPLPYEAYITEAPGYISRDNVVIASGSGVVAPNTVLGKITASGKYKPAGSSVATNAHGSVAFITNPAVNDTLTLNGTAVTFVASGATGAQVNIGANLAATLANALTVLSGSADTQLVKFTYAVSGNNLNLTAAATGTGGNALTIATTVAGATITPMAGGAAAVSDGSQNAVAVSLYGVDATSADATVTVLARTAEVNGAELVRDVSINTPALVTAQNGQLATVGIVVRDAVGTIVR